MNRSCWGSRSSGIGSRSGGRNRGRGRSRSSVVLPVLVLVVLESFELRFEGPWSLE